MTHDSTPSGYQPVTPAIAAQLRAIVGEPHVIYGEPERMQDYAHDEVPGQEYAHMPEVVVKPSSAAHVSQIMQLANRERVPVTPRGAGSGLSGGAVPIYGGVLLSMERMNHILEIDRENMVAVVEPGVVTNDINEAVKEFGLFYAGYPMSTEMCFIGGNVAENAGGGRAIKYGVTSRYVLGLEVVLPTGEIVRVGGKRVKDVTGYDLVHLLVGSEGTLGIFTQIILRLIPLPAARVVLLMPFADLSAAIAAVPRLITHSRVIPSAVEFMDRLSTQAAYDYVGEQPPCPDIGAMLLIELDGSAREQVQADCDAIVDVCMEAGAMDVYVGNTPALEKRMWKPRQSVLEALKAIDPVQSAEDLVVPMAQIPRLVSEVERLAQRHKVTMPCFGHAGDGNIHLEVIKHPDTSMEEWHATLPTILGDLYQVVAGLGGTISGEHGIGSKRARYLPLVMDPTLIALQQRIKQAFDPLHILNPGKIFAF